jgi:hypothetical protein
LFDDATYFRRRQKHRLRAVSGKPTVHCLVAGDLDIAKREVANGKLRLS